MISVASDWAGARRRAAPLTPGRLVGSAPSGPATGSTGAGRPGRHSRRAKSARPAWAGPQTAARWAPAGLETRAPATLAMGRAARPPRCGPRRRRALVCQLSHASDVRPAPCSPPPPDFCSSLRPAAHLGASRRVSASRTASRHRLAEPLLGPTLPAGEERTARVYVPIAVAASSGPAVPRRGRFVKLGRATNHCGCLASALPKWKREVC